MGRKLEEAYVGPVSAFPEVCVRLNEEKLRRLEDDAQTLVRQKRKEVRV